jgi:hypothetical protein
MALALTLNLLLWVAALVGCVAVLVIVIQWAWAVQYSVVVLAACMWAHMATAAFLTAVSVIGSLRLTTFGCVTSAAGKSKSYFTQYLRISVIKVRTVGDRFEHR